MAPSSLCVFVLLETTCRGCLEEVKPFALKGRMTTAAVNDNRLDDCQVARCRRLKQAATYSAAAVQNPLILSL